MSDEIARLDASVRSAAHDLRSPLNTIIGFAELMLEGRVGPLAAEHREYLTDILNSARELLARINAVVERSRQPIAAPPRVVPASVMRARTLPKPLFSRLPALVCVLVAGVIVLFLWASFTEVERTLLTSTGERLTVSANQISALLAQSTRQRLDELERLARSDVVTGFVADPSEQTRTAVEQTLRSISGPPQQTFEVWAGDKQLLVVVKPSARGDTLPAGSTTPAPGLSVMQATSSGTVYSSVAMPVRDSATIVVRRAIQLTPPDILSRLAGGEARVLLGGVDGGVWTDLQKIVETPRVNLHRPGMVETSDSSDRSIGSLAPIAGTPWAVWVALPRASVVKPAYAFLGRMGMAGLIFLGLAIAIVQVWTTAARRAREQAQEELDQFFSVSLDLLCIAGADGNFRRVNPAWERVLGWTDADLTNAPYVSFVHPEDRGKTEDEATRLGAGGTTVDFENRYRRKDGTYRWLSWKAATGGDNVIYAAARDVTAEKEASIAMQRQAAALTAAREDAERANQAKNIFLSHMSHDLRTPLNSILGFAQLLAMSNLDEERRDHVQQILSGGHHLLDLITDVLDIARIDSGQLSLSIEPVSVSDVIERSVSLVKPLAASNGVEIVVDPAVPQSLGIYADRQRIRQIILNLLSNAVKYNRRGGRVTISAKSGAKDSVRILIADTGAGIPESKQSKLFERFERLGAEQTAVEGTGLGLALSKSLAQAMHGSLGFTSQPGQGSTFWVELARAELPADSAVPAGEPVPESGEQRATIVYVEDNASNVRLMQGIIRQRPSLDLIHEATGEGGLAVIQKRRPNLVIVDLHLPDIGGDEIVRRLRQDPRTAALPIIVATADASPGVVRRMQAAGATACLSKPLDIQKLLQLFDELI